MKHVQLNTRGYATVNLSGITSEHGQCCSSVMAEILAAHARTGSVISSHERDTPEAKVFMLRM